MTADDLIHIDIVGDDAVVALLQRLYRTELARYEDEAEQMDRWDEQRDDPFAWTHFAFPVRPEQGAALYALVRAARPALVVEFATSLGFSTVFLAAAVRDNGEGRIVSAELVPEKAHAARASLAEVGLDPYVEIREGDALDTLADLPAGQVDLLVLDGWPSGAQPSIDRRVLDLVTPALRPGAIVFDDNGEDDTLERLADRTAGFRLVHGHIGGGHLAIHDRAR